MINGLAGIGRVLLAAVTASHPAAERGLTAALEALTKMIMSPRGTRPGWWLPAAMHPPTVKSDLSGSAATGMAHGIAGPLACLAAASTGGWSVPCQDAAIRHAARWLLDWKADETWQWPSSVSGAELDASEAASAITAASGPSRPSAIPRPGDDATEHQPGFLVGAAGTARATAAINSAGYAGRVIVLTGDGEHGAPRHAPFDAVIVTAGAWRSLMSSGNALATSPSSSIR